MGQKGLVCFNKLKIKNYEEQHQILYWYRRIEAYFDASLMAIIDYLKQPIETSWFENSIQGLKEFYKMA